MKPPAMGRAPFRSSGNRSHAKMLTKQPTSAELASLTMMQVCGKGGSLSLAYSVKFVSDQVIFQQIIRNSCRNSRIPSKETRWFSKCFGILTKVFKNTAAICSSDKILTGEVDYNTQQQRKFLLSNLSTFNLVGILSVGQMAAEFFKNSNLNFAHKMFRF